MKRFVLVVITLLLIAITMPLQPAHASSYYIRLRYTSGNPGQICDTSGFIVPLTMTYYLPPTGGASSSYVQSINGLVVGSGGAPLPFFGGPATIPAGVSNFDPQLPTYTSVTVVTYTLNGETIGKYEISLACSPSSMIVTLKDLSVSSLLFTDGRLNQNPDASVVLYCKDGGVEVYQVINSVGNLAFKVSKADIEEAFKNNGNKHLLIKSAQGIRLYALSSDELQVNALKPDRKEYVFRWDGC